MRQARVSDGATERWRGAGAWEAGERTCAVVWQAITVRLKQVAIRAVAPVYRGCCSICESRRGGTAEAERLSRAHAQQTRAYQTALHARVRALTKLACGGGVSG